MLRSCCDASVLCRNKKNACRWESGWCREEEFTFWLCSHLSCHAVSLLFAPMPCRLLFCLLFIFLLSCLLHSLLEVSVSFLFPIEPCVCVVACSPTRFDFSPPTAVTFEFYRHKSGTMKKKVYQERGFWIIYNEQLFITIPFTKNSIYIIICGWRYES